MVARASSALAVLMPPSRRKSAACCVLAINLAIFDSAIVEAASSDDSNVSLWGGWTRTLCRSFSNNMPAAELYRVFHQLVDLGLVDFKFSSSTVCLVLLKLMGIWQNQLGSLGRLWNIQINANQTQVR